VGLYVFAGDCSEGNPKVRPDIRTRRRHLTLSGVVRILSAWGVYHMRNDSKIFIAGHRGLVGGAIGRALLERGFTNIVTRSRQELDLSDQAAVSEFFKKEKPEYVFLAAAKVGGILFNQRYQADFLFENLITATNVINSAFNYDTKKLLFLGSSCIYPKMAPQPLKEESLLSGPLEPTNEGYAIAKIACLKLCEKYYQQYGREFISVMPTNLYGPGDNFHPEHSHVIPGLMRRFHEAKISGSPSVVTWGTGTPRREFLHVDDLASALLLVMERYSDPGIINVGTGEDVTLRELSEMMREVVGFPGSIEFDTSKPDGTPRKVLDVTKIRSLGWSPSFSLSEGLRATYTWALANGKFPEPGVARLERTAAA
jgi:GDP-L-fucose synthase